MGLPSLEGSLGVLLSHASGNSVPEENLPVASAPTSIISKQNICFDLCQSSGSSTICFVSCLLLDEILGFVAMILIRWPRTFVKKLKFRLVRYV